MRSHPSAQRPALQSSLPLLQLFTRLVASPSICCYLTTVANSAQPSFCGPLNFLDTQILFDAMFLPLDCKPIFALSVTSTQVSPVSCPDDTTETAIQVCCLLVFKAMLRLDYIGHHNFSSTD